MDRCLTSLSLFKPPFDPKKPWPLTKHKSHSPRFTGVWGCVWDIDVGRSSWADGTPVTTHSGTVSGSSQ